MNNEYDKIPVPIIDPALCDACGLCVQVCPTKALALKKGVAFVADPLACEYSGHCELICPVHAINRPFQIIISSEKES